MKNYSGKFELGDSTSRDVGNATLTTYSYIKCGNEYIRNVIVKEGLEGLFRNASERGEEIKVHIENGHMIGAEFVDGQVIGSDYGGSSTAALIWWVITLGLFVLLITAPFAIFTARIAGETGRCAKRTQLAKSLPNVQLL